MADGLRTYAGAVAIVTGGASGIGRALSEELARRGAEVVVADRQHELAAQVAEGITRSAGHATPAALDVTDAAAFANLVRDSVQLRGRLDFLFNNAGIGVLGDVLLYGPKDWDQVFDVNLRGVAYGIQAAYPVMAAQRYGHIVNTASMAGLLPMPLAVSYCATKHAVVGLSLALRLEAQRHGVRVTALCPGVIRTPILMGGVFGRNLTAASEQEARVMWEGLRPIDPAPFARKALDAIARNPAIAMVPSWLRVGWWLQRLFPGLALRLGAVHLARTLERCPKFLSRR